MNEIIKICDYYYYIIIITTELTTTKWFCILSSLKLWYFIIDLIWSET